MQQFIVRHKEEHRIHLNKFNRITKNKGALTDKWHNFNYLFQSSLK